jgi:transposase-like protein
MPNSPLTRDEMQAAVNAAAKHGGVTAAAKALGVNRATLQARVAAADAAGIRAGVPGVDPRQRIAQLEKDLKAATREQADTAALKQIIGTAAMGLDKLNAPDWTVKPRTLSCPGVPTLQLSDFHWGERVFPKQVNDVNSYSLDIARERLKSCVETAVHLCRILDRDMLYPGIVVPLGGDMVSGAIHEELRASNEIPTMPTVLDLVDNLVPAITALADTFGAVFLPCVSGNHGRDTHKIYAKGRNHTSFDWLLYQFLARALAHDKRVTFFIPEGSDAAYRIYAHKYVLTHGDQFRGGDGMIGALGPILRGDHKKRSRNAQIEQDYDTLVMGHWHQRIMLTRVIVNPALKGYDEYAFTNNFPFEPPAQNWWITHPEHGITWDAPIYVDKAKKFKPQDWVSVPRGRTRRC